MRSWRKAMTSCIRREAGCRIDRDRNGYTALPSPKLPRPDTATAQSIIWDSVEECGGLLHYYLRS